jgi:hypothetical protein
MPDPQTSRAAPPKGSSEFFTAQGGQARLAPFLVFVVMTIALLSASWKAAQGASIEIGDFAADSLLVQEAKSFHLLVGNYSRIGFNHPGPAILYVLAAGEYLFYDELKLTPQPAGGQLLGVEVYIAFWIALLFRLLQRLAGSTATALFATALFLAISARILPWAFSSLWFAHLHYFPFAVFLFSLSQLVRGRTDSLYILALSWGFLLNGHIAFFPMTAIMVLCTFLANGRLSRGRACPVAPLLHRSTWQGRRPDALGAAGVLALFLMPLAIRMFIETPNPLVQYLTYSGGNAWNSLAASATFVAFFWGGWMGFLGGLAALAFFWILERMRNQSALVRAIGSGVLCATLAIGFYAIVGVDDLSLTYVGLFYYSAPLALVALGACLACRWSAPLAGGRLPFLVSLLVPLFLIPVWKAVNRLPAPVSDARIAEDFTRIRALGPLPLHLDLDASPCAGNNWGRVWSRLVGVENYARRKGINLFVIRRRWQILFTKKAKFSGPPNTIPEHRFYVTSVDLPGAALRTNGLSFLPLHPLLLTPHAQFTVAADKSAFQQHFLEDQWSFPEADFTWSQGPQSDLILEFAQTGPHRIYLDLGAYLPPGQTQHVDLTANGVPVGKIDFTKPEDQKYFFDLPSGLSNPVVLQIHIAHPMRPHDYEKSRDMRKLGVSLYGLGVALARVDMQARM